MEKMTKDEILSKKQDYDDWLQSMNLPNSEIQYISNDVDGMSSIADSLEDKLDILTGMDSSCQKSVSDSIQHQDSQEKSFKETQLSDDEDHCPTQLPTLNQSVSQFFDQYLDLIGRSQKISDYQLKDQQNQLKDQQKFKQKKIFQFEAETIKLEKILLKKGVSVRHYQEFIPSIRILNVKNYAGYEIVRLDVRIGKYEKTVTIYNLLEESCFHCMAPFNSGAFGNIYLLQYLGNEFVVKCITKTSLNSHEHIANQQNKHLILIEIVREYMIAYIAGVLEIGPKVINPFGFDLIVSKECIEFFIEKVSFPEYNLKNLHSKFDNIKQSLFKLHLLNIVHNDIKPENIMYSDSSKKLLLIDFGLSEYLTKPIGHKKETKFIGTYQYSSPDMQKLLFQHESAMIDLYHNDAYSLNMALNKLFQIQKGQKNQEKSKTSEITIQNQVTGFLNKIYLKYLILQQNIKDVITLSNIIEIKRKFKLQQEILDFLLKIPLSSELKHFYHQSLHHSVKNMSKFQKLQDLYVRNISFLDVEFQQKDQTYKDFLSLYQHFFNMQLQDQTLGINFRQPFFTKSQKIRLIHSPQQNFSSQKILSLYLDLINFLKSSQKTSIGQKNQISSFLIQRLQIPNIFCHHTSIQISSQLSPILVCLFYIANFCLSKPFNFWKAQNFVHAISMMMVLGWDIPDLYLNRWRQAFCTNLTEVQEIIQIFLEFMILERISLDRFFKIQNEISLKELDQKVQALSKDSEQPKETKKSVLHHFLEQRKLQKMNQKLYSNQLCQNIFIQMLQFEQNPEPKTPQKLDSLLKEIQDIPHTLFKNKKHHQWTKNHLSFWVLTHFVKMRVEQQKQLNILLKMKKQTASPDSEIHIFSFELMSNFSIFRNITKMNEQIDNVDKAINAKQISRNLCTHRRFIKAFMNKDFSEVEKIIDRIHQLQTFKLCDMNLMRHLSIYYQNFVWLLKYSGQNEYFALLHEKVKKVFHDFIILFKLKPQVRNEKVNRQIFSESVRSLLAVKLGSNSELGQLSQKEFICQNQNEYLQIFEDILRENPDKIMKKSFLISKINYLRNTNKCEQICEFLEKDEELNIQNFIFKDFVDLSILVEYYRSKIILKKQETLYLSKFKQLCEDLIDKKCYFDLFNNRNFFELINQKIQNPQITLEYFKSLTEYLTKNPSVANTQILMNYINSYRDLGIHKVKKILLKKERQVTSKETQFDKNEIIQETSQLFKEFHMALRSEVKRGKAWRNPYLVFLLFFQSIYTETRKKEISKILLDTAHTLPFMNQTAKKYILNWHFWRVINLDIQDGNKARSKNYRSYITKKHLYHTSTKFRFFEILQARLKYTDLNSVGQKKYVGYFKVIEKIYNYYSNSDTIEMEHVLEEKVNSEYDLSERSQCSETSSKSLKV